MELEEHRLLHLPDLMLALLKVAERREAALDDALALLTHDRAEAGEPADIPSGRILARLNRARRRLAAAGLIEQAGGNRFRITPRGSDVLHKHPEGVDDSVLMDFPEFQAWLAETIAHPPPEDARRPEFLDGWSAFLGGAPLTGNPFASQTAQHAAWEDGWLEAMHQRGEG